MIQHARQLLSSPSNAIANAKRQKALVNSIGILVADWVLVGIAIAALLMGGASKLPLVGGVVGLAGGAVAVAVAVLGFLCSLFVAWPTFVALNLLGGKGGYFEGLTPIAYALFVPAVGLLAASLLSFIPVIGGIAAFVVIALAVAIGLATYLRGLSELFGVNLLTALIGAAIIHIALMAAIWFMAVPATLAGLWALPSLPLTPGI